MAKDDAPWLAEAPAQRGRTQVSRRSFFITLTSILALVAIVALGAFLLISRQEQGNSEGYMEAAQAPLIPAEPGPFKIKPQDPMGLDVEGQDQTLYAAGIGIDEASNIDTAAVPEEPLPRPGAAGATSAAAGTAKNLLPPAMAAEQTQRTSSQTSPEPALSMPAIVPELPRNSPGNTPEIPRNSPVSPAVSNKPLVQLGAFSSRERAESAWSSLVARHGLIGVTPQYSNLQRDGKTLWRLRAEGANASEICARLAKSGDICSVVTQ